MGPRSRFSESCDRLRGDLISNRSLPFGHIGYVPHCARGARFWTQQAAVLAGIPLVRAHR